MCGTADTDTGAGDIIMRNNIQKDKKAGFTLIELMIAMVIGAVVIGALATTYQRFVASVTAQNVGADLQLSGRAAIEYMVREILNGRIYSINSRQRQVWC